jgi:hypothetical protein
MGKWSDSEHSAYIAWIVPYLLLVYAWFDHDLGSPSSPILFVVSAVLFFIAVARRFWRAGIPRPFESRNDNRLFYSIFAVAIASRLPFLAGAYGLFSSDAAVQGVMALHILEGKHHPVFLYHWSYIGSIKAHLTALATLFSGEPVLSFAAAAVLMFGAFAAGVFALARTVLPRAESVVAALYVIAGPGFLTAWASHNEGNYTDVMVMGTAMLILGARMVTETDGRVRRAFWMGVLGGLAFWTHILATYYLLALMLVLVACDWSLRVFRRLAAFGFGFVVGDFPGILWNATHAWLSFRWWALDQSQSSDDRWGRTTSQLWEVVTTSSAVLAGWWPLDHPPWLGGFWRWALLAVFPVAAIAFAVRFRVSLRPLLRGRLTPHSLMLGFAILVVVVFAQSSFGWMTDEPRYLLFLYSVFPAFIASALASLWSRRRWVAVVVGFVLIYVNLHGSLVYFVRGLEGDRVNRQFLEDLEALRVSYGHSDYYVSYKYNFLSHGRLVLTSELGPAQKEWYLPYREEVSKAEDVALIPRSFRFARRLGRRLDAKGITYRREDLLYPVLFDFSEKVGPEDLR